MPDRVLTVTVAIMCGDFFSYGNRPEDSKCDVFTLTE